MDPHRLCPPAQVGSEPGHSRTTNTNVDLKAQQKTVVVDGVKGSREVKWTRTLLKACIKHIT